MSEGDADILREVRERFKHCDERESEARSRYLDDLRFLHGDAYNKFQWDEAVVRARNPPGQGGRPCLTVNKVAQHVLQITNDARQNQMGVKVVATGFGATAKAAEAMEGIVRHIEAQSNAQQNAYANAILGQVGGGIGWIHVVTDYVRGADTFDQDLFIESVPDPLSVYSDPDCREPDHSDMQWAMIVTTMPRAEFEREYPRDKDLGDKPFQGLDLEDKDWDSKDTVRVAKYYRRSEEGDTLWNVPPLPAMQFAGGPMRESQMPPELVELCKAQNAQRRQVMDHRVDWFLIGGDRVIDSGDTVFKNIPLVPFIGIETLIDGKLDRKGLTRALTDPQRMFNYAASKFIEGLAAQTVGSWVASDAMVAGRENEWAQSNISPPGVLVYNSINPDDGTPVSGAPEVVPPPQFSPGYMQAMQTSDLQMQMASGQYQAEMGAPGNERSGKAINERQRQSDTANYHYTDNQGMALRLIGRILIDAIPAVYDTQRAVQVLGLDGAMTQAIVDPNLQQAHAVAVPDAPDGTPQQPPAGDPEDQLQIEGAILAVNPRVGRYDVQADVGPAWATQRQETFNALMQAMQAAPELMQKCGDLLFRSADFPLADVIADRLKPASEDPALMQAQQMIQQLQQHIGQLTQQLKDKAFDQNLRMQEFQHDKVMDAMRHDVDMNKADTDRMAAIGSEDPTMLQPVLLQLVRQVLGPNAIISMGAPAPLDRMPSDNPPGGPIRAPEAVNGAVQ